MASTRSSKTISFFLTIACMPSLFTSGLAQAQPGPSGAPFPGPGIQLPPEVLRCWSSITSVQGCREEILNSLFSGEVGSFDPPCCDAITRVTDDCWQKMIPYDPFFPVVVVDLWLTALVSLNVSNSSITSDGLQSLKPLKNLRSLSLESCKVTASDIKHLSQLLSSTYLTSAPRVKATPKTDLANLLRVVMKMTTLMKWRSGFMLSSGVALFLHLAFASSDASVYVVCLFKDQFIIDNEYVSFMWFA
ncbi:Prolamin-like domain [Dillenia turbinata]|uniref:Prolamin-like domain n=1 Tax=Dillenia turbinata TaxID=194707 RepID=A0AAN8ZRR8_9MAGN